MKSRGTKITPDFLIPIDSIDSRAIELGKKILTCYECPGLNIPKRTEGAPGYGSVPAELMVVGQSLHGYNDATPDRQIPFVGPIKKQDSGVLLYNILKLAGYTFANGNLFVTNVVKCHPPNNRTSLPQEIINCHKHLQKEITYVQPKIILTVGSSARQKFKLPSLSAQSFASYHKHSSAKKRVVPLSVYYVMIVHPSAILRFYGTQKRQPYIDECVRTIRKVRGMVCQTINSR